MSVFGKEYSQIYDLLYKSKDYMNIMSNKTEVSNFQLLFFGPEWPKAKIKRTKP